MVASSSRAIKHHNPNSTSGDPLAADCQKLEWCTTGSTTLHSMFFLLFSSFQFLRIFPFYDFKISHSRMTLEPTSLFTNMPLQKCIPTWTSNLTRDKVLQEILWENTQLVYSNNKFNLSDEWLIEENNKLQQMVRPAWKGASLSILYFRKTSVSPPWWEQPTGDVGTLAHVNEAVNDGTLPFSLLKALLHLENLSKDFRINLPLIGHSLHNPLRVTGILEALQTTVNSHH